MEKYNKRLSGDSDGLFSYIGGCIFGDFLVHYFPYVRVGANSFCRRLLWLPYWILVSISADKISLKM